MLAYVIFVDIIDLYCRLIETSGPNCITRSCDAVVAVFGPMYMRMPPNMIYANFSKSILQEVFPASSVVLHREWKNCSATWKCQFQGTFLWHLDLTFFFGVSGKLNDFTVVVRSQVSDEVFNGVAHTCNFEVNVHQYYMRCYLNDDIYQKWVMVVKSIKVQLLTHTPSFLRRKAGEMLSTHFPERCWARIWSYQQNPALAKSSRILETYLQFPALKVVVCTKAPKKHKIWN